MDKPCVVVLVLSGYLLICLGKSLDGSPSLVFDRNFAVGQSFIDVRNVLVGVSSSIGLRVDAVVRNIPELGSYSYTFVVAVLTS